MKNKKNSEKVLSLENKLMPKSDQNICHFIS